MFIKIYTLVFTFPVRLCLSTRLPFYLTPGYIPENIGISKPMKIQH